jgi:hypothetical protein
MSRVMPTLPDCGAIGAGSDENGCGENGSLLAEDGLSGSGTTPYFRGSAAGLFSSKRGISAGACGGSSDNIRVKEPALLPEESTFSLGDEASCGSRESIRVKEPALPLDGAAFSLLGEADGAASFVPKLENSCVNDPGLFSAGGGAVGTGGRRAPSG